MKAIWQEESGECSPIVDYPDQIQTVYEVHTSVARE